MNLTVAIGLSAAVPWVTWAASPAAESMFQEGRRLLREGQTAEACARFSSSLAIEASSGTLLNLALCHEKQGKTATAWAEYRAAARLARTQGREDRALVAEEKAMALEPILARLTATAERPVPGETIATETGTLGEGAIGVAVPLDPGLHTVTVTAPNHHPWSTTINVAEGDQTSLPIPPLVPDTPDTASIPRAYDPVVPILSAPIAAGGHSRSVRRPSRLDAYLAAGAAALLATGAGLWSVAYLQLGDATDVCNTSPGCTSGERQDRVSSIRRLEWLAVGSWVAAGGLAVAAGTRVWLSGTSLGSKDEATVSWTSNLRLTRKLLFAAGALAAGASAGFGGLAYAKKREYESEQYCAYGCPALNVAHQAANISTGFAVAATVLGSVGASTFLYRPAAPSTRTQSHDLAVVVGERSVALTGTF